MHGALASKRSFHSPLSFSFIAVHQQTSDLLSSSPTHPLAFDRAPWYAGMGFFCFFCLLSLKEMERNFRCVRKYVYQIPPESREQITWEAHGTVCIRMAYPY